MSFDPRVEAAAKALISEPWDRVGERTQGYYRGKAEVALAAADAVDDRVPRSEARALAEALDEALVERDARVGKLEAALREFEISLGHAHDSDGVTRVATQDIQDGFNRLREALRDE